MHNHEQLHPFWAFNRTVSNRLLTWSGFSVLVGLIMSVLQSRFWKGVGIHFIVWGIIDAAIAGFGLVSVRRKIKAEDANHPETLEKESQNLAFLLALNGVLDVFYVLGGLWLLRKRGQDDPHFRGQGIGVIIQGGFLCVFDWVHWALLQERKR